MVCSGRTAQWWSTLTGSSRMLIWACSLLTAASGCRATLGSGGLDPARIAPTESSANDHEVGVHKTHQHTKQTYIDFNLFNPIYSNLNYCLFNTMYSHINSCLFKPIYSHPNSCLFFPFNSHINYCLFNHSLFIQTIIQPYLNSCLFNPVSSHINYY